MDIYTPIEEAGEIIRARWADKELRKKVEEKLNGDIPEILKDGPSGMIWRHIGTPDGEFSRFLELNQKANLNPVCFEYIKDKFVAENFTKYALTNLSFSIGLNKNSQNMVKKEKIINFIGSEGKRMDELKTLWGENLVDFHHSFLQSTFPIMANRVVDMSGFFKKRGGQAKEYYSDMITFAVSHLVFFEDFDLLESEMDFIKEIVLPGIKEVEKRFGLKPIIVKISKAGEHDRDPNWWCYSEKAREILDNHIKTFKQ